jgi:hypothetical protein
MNRGEGNLELRFCGFCSFHPTTSDRKQEPVQNTRRLASLICLLRWPKMARQMAAARFSIGITISHYYILWQLGGSTVMCMEVTAK